MPERNQTQEETLNPSLNLSSPTYPRLPDSDGIEVTDLLPEKGITGQSERLSRLQAAIETSLIVIGLLAIFFLLPREMGGDGTVRYQTLINILHHMAPHMKYSLIGPSFALPLVWIGQKLGYPTDWALVYNQILFALSLLMGYLLLKNHMDRVFLRRFYLLLIIASMFVAHLSFFYGEVFTALCVGFGVLFTYLRLTAPAAWLLIAVGAANTPAALGGLVMLLLKRIVDSKRLRYGLVFLMAAIFVSIDAWLQRGSPLNTGYSNDHGFTSIMPYSGLPGFSYPFFFGLLSLLLSFGKGLLFFAPGLLLPVRKTLLRQQKENQIPLYQVYTLWIAFVIGLILVYARWWAWYGGVFWGPRFLLLASIPASFALAVRLLNHKEASLAVNLLTLLVFILSVWVCIDGAIYQSPTAILPLCAQNNYNLEMLCYYTPEFSPLWLPFVHHYALNTHQKLFMGYVVITAAYLALPLCIQLVRQSSDLVRKYSQMYLTPGEWRI